MTDEEALQAVEQRRAGPVEAEYLRRTLAVLRVCLLASEREAVWYRSMLGRAGLDENGERQTAEDQASTLT